MGDREAPGAEALDREVRLRVFARLAETGRAPSPAGLASALGVAQPGVEDALRRLAAARLLVLAPATANVWLAPPFAAVPSDFRVEARGRTYWATCAWDALGRPRPPSAPTPPSRPAAPTPGRTSRWRCAAARWSGARGWSTSRCRPPAGGRTSPSPEGGCGSSGRRGTSTAGARSGGWRGARRCPPSGAGGWPWPGTGDRLAPGWRPKTAEEAEAALAGAGLTGPFWRLRP
jgi:hypothetical protein